MVRSDIEGRIFEYVSKETRTNILGPNCYDFKKLSVLAQTIRSLYNSLDFKKVFLAILTAVWNIKCFLYHGNSPCFEEVYLNIRD